MLASATTAAASRDRLARGATSSKGIRGASSEARAGHRYELLGEIATGGMATVYLARLRRPLGFARLVAIKAMHPQYAKDPDFVAMFVDEARLTARLRHPNIVPTVDIVAEGGQLLLVMEYVDGESLSGLLRSLRERGDRIPVPVACAIVHDVLLGLHEAHEAADDDGTPLAIVHRDVSPQNVLVGGDGLARLLDFGVAKAKRSVHHSADGEIKGKLPYMAPEQLFGEDIDRTVDVWAAGVLLWEALVGARLFEGSTESAVAQKIASSPVPRPSARAAGVSPELDAVVARALSQSPSDRFRTALAMAEALAAAAPLAPRTDVAAWMRRFPRRKAAAPAPAPSLAALLGGETRTRTAVVTPRPRGTLARAALPVAASLAVVAVAAIAFARTTRPASADEPRAQAPVTAPMAPRPAEPPAAAPARLAAPQAPEAPPARPTAVRRPRSAPRAIAPAADAEPHASSAPPRAVTSEPAKAASCRLPYVVDAAGHRHYKVECL